MYVRMYICNMYMYVCMLLRWPTSVTIQSLQTLRHNGYLSLGQPAKPQPSLVPAIINITWSHRSIHYLHLCMYAFHWVQGSRCTGIESPRDTKLSPGLCSSLTRKVTHQWGDSGMIPSFPGSPRLGEERAWEWGCDDWTEQLTEAAHKYPVFIPTSSRLSSQVLAQYQKVRMH